MTEPQPAVAEVDLGSARLLPDIDRANAYLLTVEGIPQSYVDLDDPAYLEFEYVRRLAHVVDLLAPRSILHLGGAGMTLPRYVAATIPGTRQRVVECDAALLDLVRERLPFDPRIEVELADAHDAVRKTPANSADLIVVDVFAGPDIPPGVVSAEFLADAARALRPGGVYAANIADGAPFPFARAVAATASAVFGWCRIAAEPGVFRGRRFGNLMLLGAAGEPRLADLARLLSADTFPARLQDAHEFAAGAGPIRDGAPAPEPAPTSDFFESNR